MARINPGQQANMTSSDRAELIESIHQPWKASLGECLSRWRGLDAVTRAQSYLVVQGPTGHRTLNGHKIAELAAEARWA